LPAIAGCSRLPPGCCRLSPGCCRLPPGVAGYRRVLPAAAGGAGLSPGDGALTRAMAEVLRMHVARRPFLIRTPPRGRRGRLSCTQPAARPSFTSSLRVVQHLVEFVAVD